MTNAAVEVVNSPDLELQGFIEYVLMNSSREKALDRLTALAARVLSTPMVLLSIVDSEKEFIKSFSGLGEPWATGREIPLSHSFSKYVVASGAALIIADVREQSLVRDEALLSESDIVAYAGVPLTTARGSCLGAFCAIDTQPRQWTAAEIETLEELAASVLTFIEISLKQYQTLIGLRTAFHSIRKDFPSAFFYAGFLEDEEQTGALNGDQRAYVGFIIDSMHRLQHRLGSIADLFGIGPIGLCPFARKLEPAHIVARYAQPEPPFHSNLNYVTAVAPNLPLFESDPHLLHMALLNLQTAAILLTRAGGTITTAARLADDGKAIVFSAGSVGEVIPPEVLGQIFDKSFQMRIGDAENHNRIEGKALAFAKKIGDALGARIWVESEIDKGTTFLFSIPLPPESGRAG